MRITRRRLIGACALLVGAVVDAAAGEATMKRCPIDKHEMQRVPCPSPGGDMRSVAAGGPVAFHACAVCPKGWSGVAVEQGTGYRIEVVGDPDRWKDKDISFPTARAALDGFERISEAAGKPWWSGWFWDAAFAILASKRPVPDAGWFQLFAAVRDAEGRDSDPQRITLDGGFTAPASGELFVFVNDHPAYYGNNSGRMRLEISLAE